MACETTSFSGRIRHRGAEYCHVDLRKAFGEKLERLPWVLRILAENVLRSAGKEKAAELRDFFLRWLGEGTSTAELEIFPVRLMMHDTTCIPALVDLAAVRDAVAEDGFDPAVLNPVLPVDVSVDHSISVQHFGDPAAVTRNIAREYELNSERYRMMKWAARAMGNIHVHPPGTGIMHTINLEQLATVVTTVRADDGRNWCVPDLMLGTDSHTPMVNGIGVLAWGVGGLEAESVMFGLPVVLRLPDIVGVKLIGELRDGVMATDLALIVTQRLRDLGVSGEFVEFFGPGVSSLSGNDRAVIANMAPEYGASSGYFAVDHRSCDYLRTTGRPEAHVELVERAAAAIGIGFDPTVAPVYTRTIEIDLAMVATGLAGPKRPQDRVETANVRSSLERAAGRPLLPAKPDEAPDGAVAIAAITSCTNTSSPQLLIAAGLLAREARRRGLRPAPWVKTSLAPGSPSARNLLARAGLLDDLEAIGFSIVGYGCTTCIGNSGPLTPQIEQALRQKKVAVAVLSGNRNFPGRVHPDLMYGFLASPPLVVAFALAGDVRRDVLKEPIGCDRSGKPVLLRDLWPSDAAIEAHLKTALRTDDYRDAFQRAEQSERWEALPAPSSVLFPWDENSTYLRPPPFARASGTRLGHYRAHPLMLLGDDVTTDHITPAGQIPVSSPAATHLMARGEARNSLNVFAARRGNWEVMLRGLFTNRGVVNRLAGNIPAGYTVHAPSGEVLPIFEAAQRYAGDGESVVIVAGERYGAGSSRDWAAKGPALLGVRAVLAKSFERIHRTNLIGMGILPVRLSGDAEIELHPGDMIELDACRESVRPRAEISVLIRRSRAPVTVVRGQLAIQTEQEVELLRAGGVLPALRVRASEYRPV